MESRGREETSELASSRNNNRVNRDVESFLLNKNNKMRICHENWFVETLYMIHIILYLEVLFSMSLLLLCVSVFFFCTNALFLFRFLQHTTDSAGWWS